MSTSDDKTRADKETRNRSAEERGIVAPTPADVRATAGGATARPDEETRHRPTEEGPIVAPTPAAVRTDADDEDSQPPPAGSQAP